MRVRYLGWAGLEVEAAGSTVVVDLVEDISSMAPYVGEPREPLMGPSRSGEARVALVTHLHPDHADPAAIARALAPDGVMLQPAPAEGGRLETAGTAVAEAGIVEAEIATRVLEPWETIEVGPFQVAAIPAADGFGEPQLSWVVAAGGCRIFHGGDTLFHGWWWLAKVRHGPFDAAFLPVNGPIVDLPYRQPPSPLPAAMDPVQAATAAAILEAREAVPIHYGTLHKPPTYVQVKEPAGAFVATAEAAGVRARVLESGEVVEFADRA